MFSLKSPKIKLYGRPILLASFEDPNNINEKNEELERIFKNEEVKNRKIVVISVIGAFRGGKSFLLGYFLRYLYANYSSMNNPNPIHKKSANKWMGNKMAPLEGFDWQFGMDRVTSGIVMWSDVFFHTCDVTGDKIAILLLDTQGLFDNQSTSDDNFRVFALGTLLSSIQIFNISTRIQEDHLQYLQFATNFAQCFGNNQDSDDSDIKPEKPFEKLIFLVRDFLHSKDFSYGMDGGFKYIKKVIFDKQHSHKQELQSVRKQITNTFDQVQCCLLPHPGSEVGQGYKYDGNWSKMDKPFKDEFKKFIEYICGPSNLVTKKINSVELTGREMKIYFDTYLKLFQSGGIPEVKNFADATKENFMNELIEKCLDDFTLIKSNFEEIKCIDEIPQKYEDLETNILNKFDASKKMGDALQITEYREKLKSKLKESYEQWREHMINLQLERLMKEKDNEKIRNDYLTQILKFAFVTGFIVLGVKSDVNIGPAVVLTNFIASTIFEQIKRNFSNMGVSSNNILGAFKNFIPNDEVLMNQIKTNLNLDSDDKKIDEYSKLEFD